MAEHVDDTMRSADAQIEALKRTKPSNAAEARARTAELMRLQQVLLEASRKVVSANATKRLANGNGKAPVRVVATDLSEELLLAMVEGIAGYYNPLLTAIEKRIAELEATALRDGDIWREGVSYRRNALVTHNGHLWLARRETNKRPPGDDWRLTHHNNAKGNR